MVHDAGRRGPGWPELLPARHRVLGANPGRALAALSLRIAVQSAHLDRRATHGQWFALRHLLRARHLDGRQEAEAPLKEEIRRPPEAVDGLVKGSPAMAPACCRKSRNRRRADQE